MRVTIDDRVYSLVIEVKIESMFDKCKKTVVYLQLITAK